ncbi:MAG: hypothetical protein U5K69_28135 [Balneolaceae bacterium]|nr:hypothetical protein [Balneolaceae bacterium]
MKKDGWQGTNKKSISRQPTPVINITSRQYFSKAKDPQLLCTEGFRSSDDTCFYLDSIISYNTGKQLAAFSVSIQREEKSPVNDMAVLAGTGQFHSIINTVLPFGYGFAILNRAGEVLFHSDSNRNLQENFFDELEISNELEANMFGRTSGNIRTKYHDQSTMLHVSPIRDWPISIVTYYDISLLSLKYLEVFTLFATIYFLVLLGLGIVFVFGFVIEKWGAVFWKNAKQKPILTLGNIAPKKSHRENYAALMICYTVLIPLFSFWAYLEHPGIAILICTFLVCLQYWTLRYFFSDHSNYEYWIARIFELVAISGGIGAILVLEFNQALGWKSYLYLLLAITVLAVFVYGWRHHAVPHDDSIEPAWHWLKKIPFLRNTGYLQSYFRTIFLASLNVQSIVNLLYLPRQLPAGVRGDTEI